MDGQPRKDPERKTEDYMAEKLQQFRNVRTCRTAGPLRGDKRAGNGLRWAARSKGASAARILRPMMSVGALLPWVYPAHRPSLAPEVGSHRRGRAQELAGRRSRAPPDVGEHACGDHPGG